MSIHRPHPLKGMWGGNQYDDPEGVVLYDDCARCDQHAQSVLSLSNDNIGRLWDEMLLVEYDHDARDYYRTTNEVKACFFLYKMSIISGRVFGLTPEQLKALKDIGNNVQGLGMIHNDTDGQSYYLASRDFSEEQA